jgi:hypothetical protein
MGFFCAVHIPESGMLSCGSGLARESGVPVTINAGCAAVIAGKPAPTRIIGGF